MCCLWSAVSAKWMATAENDLYVKSICGSCLGCHYVGFGPESHSDRVRRSELIRISMLQQHFGCNCKPKVDYSKCIATQLCHKYPFDWTWLKISRLTSELTAHTLSSCEPRPIIQSQKGRSFLSFVVRLPINILEPGWLKSFVFLPGLTFKPQLITPMWVRIASNYRHSMTIAGNCWITS